MGKSIADCIGRHIPKARRAEFKAAIQLKMDGHKADGWGPDKLKVLSIQDMIDDLMADKKEITGHVAAKFGDTGAMSKDSSKPFVPAGKSDIQVNETAIPLTKGEAKEKTTSTYGASNKLFTKDAADAARELLRKKLAQVNSGLDPEMVQAGIQLAGYHIESGARSFVAYSQEMLSDLGEAVKPYLRGWYEAVRYYPGMETTGMTAPDQIEKDIAKGQEKTDSEKKREANNVDNKRDSKNLERDSGNAGSPEPLGEGDIPVGRGSDSRAGEPGVPGADNQEDTARSGLSVPGYEAAVIGKDGDISPFTEAPGTKGSITDPNLDQRSGDIGVTGPPVEPQSTNAVDRVAARPLEVITNNQKQRKAAPSSIKVADRADIDATLPILHEGQKQDVLFAEERFDKGSGVLFTNGTGTGKTFTGLGVIKRFAMQGKDNTLIVVPSDKIASDWIKAGRHFDLNISMLPDSSSAGAGVTVTTYANFGQNNQLAKRKWELVVADESHYLMQAADGKQTNAIGALRAVSMHPRGDYQRFSMLYAEDISKLKELSAKKEPGRIVEAKINKLRLKLDEARKVVGQEVKDAKDSRAKVVMLSATPFAYEKNIDYGEGYLFDYSKADNGAYNSGDGYDRFMMTNFGYSMRYNKLTRPGSEVNSGLMQRQFNSWLKKEKVLSGRMLDVDHDYDRRFILTESAVGQKIDDGLQWLFDNRKMWSLRERLMKRFDHLSRRYLLEAIKAQSVVPHIKEHLAMGRKVVVFHDYKKGGAFSPFDLSTLLDSVEPATYRNEDGSEVHTTIGELAKEFETERPDLQKLDFTGYHSPIVTLQKEFPGVLLYNGDVSKGDRRTAVERFQNDKSGHNLIVVQSAAGKEGISLHDTTGEKQRVLFNLGLPTQPTTAIQQEGRIYRTGQASNAIFRYLNTGTNWERYAFADTIARRSSTAENLALGEEARALMDGFVNAYENADTYPAGHEGEGIGGKDLDRAANNVLSEWDRAVAMYYGQQKKTERNKAAEGKDYFATPEPLGLKMVEWAGIKDGDSVLEPSAGHGAIARWFPENVDRTVVEPSSELASRLRMVTDAKLLQHSFEDLHVVNKYQAIVMNPPFGSGGKTAVDHIAKAETHLKDGGRIVALIPSGPSTDKKFDKWLHGVDKEGKSLNNMYLVADINLPGVTFERAGTAVMTRVVVLEKQMDSEKAPHHNNSADYTHIDNIKELFGRLEDVSMPERKSSAKEEQPTKDGKSGKTEDTGPKYVTDAEETTYTTRKGKELQGVIATDLSKEEAEKFDKSTWKVGDGYFIRMRHVQRPEHLDNTSGNSNNVEGAFIDHGTTTLEAGADYERRKETLTTEQQENTDRSVSAATSYLRGLPGTLLEGKSVDDDTPTYSHLDKKAVTSDYERSEDQSAAILLNRVMARHLNDDTWENAYAQNKLPDSLLGFGEAVEAAFGSRIIGITPKEARFDQFNGINYGGNLYINLAGDVGFANVVGHELYHQIEKDRPDLHAWFSEQARKHYHSLPEYQAMLDSLQMEGEDPHTVSQAESELLADFTGDAFADPKFLAQLAKADRSKFKQLLRSVVKWLHEVGEKLAGKDLGSSKYFNDIDTLRKHLAKVLIAFHRKDGIQRISQMDKPSFAKEEVGAKNPLAVEDIKKDPTFSRKDTSPTNLESVQEVANGFSSKWTVPFHESGKPDTSILSRIFQTPEYYFNKVAALGRVMKAALGRKDLRFNYEHKILGEDFVKHVVDIKNNDKTSYDQANDYLVDTDQTGYAFRMKFKDNAWMVFDQDKKEIQSFTDEKEAEEFMVQAESEYLAGEGLTDNAIKAVSLARKVLNAELEMRIADMRRIQEEYKKNGMPDPFLSKDIDEGGRYGIYAEGKGKPVALFASQKEADEALDRFANMLSYVAVGQNQKAKNRIAGDKDEISRAFSTEQAAKKWADKYSGTYKQQKRFGKLTVKKRTDAEMRPMTLTQAIAQMGDLRGSYFPRIRPSGEYVLIAKKTGENPRREHFDVPVANDKSGLTGAVANWSMAQVGRVFPNAAKRIQELRAQGYTIVEFKKDDKPVDEIFDASKLISSVDAIIADNMGVINKNDPDEVKAAKHVDMLLTMQIADTFKGRGALSSRMKRLESDVVWEGYETDMLKAIVQSARDTAAGMAKRDTSKAMLNAFTGRDFSWTDYQEQQKEQGLKADWDEYSQIIDDRRVHSGKQKNAYRDGRAYIIDVLRNSEHADRIMGTLQGLAVIKFLGFRVSSAAVNITNMVTGVPGTISGLTGESIHTALGRVASAASAYSKFRSGKGELSAEHRDIFQYIVDNGLDQAQFNHEAASVLRSKGGEAWNKYVVEWGMLMFGAVEKVNRATTIFAAYHAVKAKNPQMIFEEAMKEAEHISNRAHGVYGKETLPMWARGRINPLRMLYTFQKFSHNYMMNMYDLGWNRKQYKAAAYLMLSPAILAGAGASLAGPALFALAGALGIGGDDPEEEFYKWAANNFGSDTVARHGLAGLAGVNLKGSLGSNIPMPTKITELMGAPGAVITDFWKAGGLFANGEVSKGAEALLPTAFGSGFKAFRESSEGISTGNYGTVFYGKEPLKSDTTDAILRFFSFNPARLSGIREKQWNEKQVAARYAERRKEIYSELKRLSMQGKPFLTPETLKEIARFNDLVKGSGREDIKPITPQRIRVMLKMNNRASKFERNRAESMAVNE